MKAKTIRKWLIGEFTVKRLVRSVIEIYAILFLIGACCPYKLIFQPPKATYSSLPGLDTVYSGDSNAVACVYLPVSNAAYTLLYAHGNAEDMGVLMPVFELYNLRGLGVVAYDYRGYGLSTGAPTEANSYADIDAVYAHMTNALGIPPEKIIVYGRSLGGAMAMHIASRNPVAGLMLEAPFYTAYRVAIRVPIFPMDKFKNKDKIGAVKCPVFIMQGQSDWVIRPWHGKALYELAHEPKMCWWVEQAGHNDIIPVGGDTYLDKLDEFVAMVTSNQLMRSTARKADR